MSEVGMPGARRRFDAIRWQTGPAGECPTVAFWFLGAVLGVVLSISVLLDERYARPTSRDATEELVSLQVRTRVLYASNVLPNAARKIHDR